MGQSQHLNTHQTVLQKARSDRMKAAKKTSAAPLPIVLGCKARNKVTGFEGTVTGVIHYLTGCTHYGLTSMGTAKDESKTNWYDESEIDRVGASVVTLNKRSVPDSSPGPAPRKPSGVL